MEIGEIRHFDFDVNGPDQEIALEILNEIIEAAQEIERPTTDSLMEMMLKLSVNYFDWRLKDVDDEMLILSSIVKMLFDTAHANQVCH